MFTTQIKRCVAASTLVVGLMTSLNAHAIAYVGSWDPTFNLSDANFGTSGATDIQLGWRGHFLGDFGASCSPGAGTGLVAVTTGEGCAASLSSAVVDLYADTDPDKATIASIGFDLSTPGNLNVLSLLYDNGVLKQLRTTPSGLDLPTSVPEGSVYESIADMGLRWQLLFDFIDPIVVDGGIFSAASAPDYSGPQLSYVWPDCPDSGGNNPRCRGANSSDFAPHLVISTAATGVPEPGDLALAAVALTACWALGRRRGVPQLAATV